MNNNTRQSPLNVLLLTTYRHGGAGVACQRLQNALQQKNVSATLLTRSELGGRFNFYAERLSFLPWERSKSVRFAFSIANFGVDISRHPAVQSADVIHLHWWNQGLLSLKGVEALGILNKKIVWTLHDMWAFTGGCHNNRGCAGYEQVCGDCPYLRFRYAGDLSHQIWQKKKRYYPANMHIVTCSRWLESVARSSSLLGSYPISSIPNPIDTRQFQPLDEAARQAFRREHRVPEDARVLLFAAMNISNPYKGFPQFREMLEYLAKEYPAQKIVVAAVGKHGEGELAGLPFPVIDLGLIRQTSDMARIYGAVDLFVTPSLEENLPNTIMETMACGTPAVGFAVGGIPEMIDDGVNGKVTPFKDSRQMAGDIAWLLEDESRRKEMGRLAREKVLREYSQEKIAERYIEIYQN